ncbi:brix domain-containing protein ZK795.3, putative [Entamoeba dispar SAW760]|uniref:Brix domain-containing protein ZK795.3, putative n=1 Tax=Entamoeba dispar (strain ATCC PRA-260 / SAW760) TaxID=370354 RepID=B0EKE6_ENTDS|nr:brix domain-containing protein ZK795.3, putative [Entamoeba dispar SAW760]XP_001738928.1 brix domain-containing protein ZK795.3, putative [Entamoeba dispar SAW760]EDR24693.1 brix domain-containing protein ZK795.3, putative [Entamoeba dispar SAW760]EDR24984.1 brix domain-containing protein ZK795.3, putative [Entamoeba dispar SAW760]|eukprot:EDR24693.1 brix domain-containing protein ZK795.3, putative [Entamoeba dispar SAW760]
MQKQTTRLRREYLMKKSMEKYDKARLDKQAVIAQTIENGTQLPAHAKEGFDVAMTRMDAEDDATRQISTYDSEYAMAGVKDPNVFITTSKDPSSKLKEFVKEIKLIIPNSTRINRGNIQIKQLVETCRSHDVTDLIIVHENRGEPDGMIISHFPYGPTAYFGLYNVVSRHETKTSKTFSEVYPHLIFDNLTTPLGKRFEMILKYLFPVPKSDSKRVMTFSNSSDYITFRHHAYDYNEQHQLVLQEIGPRFDLRPYQIKLGTIDMDYAENEWILRSFINSATTRKLL